MNKFRAVTVLLTAISLAACGTTQRKAEAGASWSGAESLYTPFCRAADDPNAYAGRIIRIRGTLRTELHHSSGFRDASCLKSFNYVWYGRSAGDDTVVSMFKKISKTCPNSLCAGEGLLDADARLSISKNGEPLVEFLHVHSLRGWTFD